MKNKESHDVPVQKGKMNPNPVTIKQMTYPERVRERDEEMKGLRRGQTMDMHEPKRSRK